MAFPLLLQGYVIASDPDDLVENQNEEIRLASSIFPHDKSKAVEVIASLLEKIGYKNIVSNIPGEADDNRILVLASHVHDAYVKLFEAKLADVLAEKNKAFSKFDINQSIMFFDEDFLLVLRELKVVYEAQNSPMAKALAILEDFTDCDISFKDRCEIAEAFNECAALLAPEQSAGEPDTQIIDSIIEALEYQTHMNLAASGQSADEHFSLGGE